MSLKAKSNFPKIAKKSGFEHFEHFWWGVASLAYV
jgi:hypothetical protein